MNKSKKVIKPNVVGGGTAIPLGDNFYFMRGRKHEQGGIDVGPNNKNGLEVEDGEVMQMGGKHVKVYSSLPILNGKSPAQLVMAGLNPDKVFNAQERFKYINKLNDDGSKKARFGANRHFTINGNVINKAGYVFSTGERTKANLGTVSSIDKYVNRRDLNGFVNKRLTEETKRMIEQGRINKEKREKLPITDDEIIINSEEKTPKIVGYTTTNPNTGEETFHNITTNKDGKKEITITIPKEQKTITNKPELFKSRKKETERIKNRSESYIMKSTDVGKNNILAYKKKTDKSDKKEITNVGKQKSRLIGYHPVYNNPSNTNLGETTIKLEGNDVPLSALPELTLNAIERKLSFNSKKDIDPESKGLVQSVIDIDTPIIEEKPKYPDIVTGDTIMYSGNANMNGRRYYLPQSINLNSVKGGYRNRGDYRDIETQGLVLPTMHEFYRYGDLSPETINILKSTDPTALKGLIGLDKDGNIKVGRYGDFNEDDIVSMVSYDNIRGLNKNPDGTIKWAPRSDRWSNKYVFSETTSINPITGLDETGSINVGGSRANPTDKAYGFLNGGHVVIKAGDETRLISGSLQDIDKEIESMKERNNVDNVEFYMLDNGTYNLGLRTTDGKLTASDLKRYDNQNTSGGHGIYLKRLGGMEKRKKAKVGLYQDRGLGIQASLMKSLSDKWDKKHPGEDNPYAQQFVDTFADPTIYNSIMSDDAPAKGISLNRGYRGNTGLGFVMPELPNINLDYYFGNNGGNGSNGNNGGNGNNGVRNGNGGKKTPSVDPKDLELKEITPKINGLTVEPIKPPTEIKVNIPAQNNGKTNNNWWQNNGSDLISGVSKGIGSIASYLINKNMLNKLKYRGQPTYMPYTKLKTEYNINPQLDAVDRMISETDRVTDESTASSKVANARKNLKRLEALDARTQLYGIKENKETELINADKLNQQGITEKNINAYNEWAKDKAEFENNIREKQSENAVSLVSNLTAGVDDILANRQKRKQFKQNLAAIMAANPNVPKELLEEYGLNIFNGNKIKINNTKTNTNKKIKTYKNTGFKTEEEYGRWLKNTDFDKFIEWDSARTAKERKARIKQAKKEKDKNK